ncbi:MAG: isopenicillin N synthase family dioxygenase, partial [Alphaproteobacteria bacterium]
LAGKPGALAASAAELQHAQENVGFYVLTGHGVDQGLIDSVFEQTARFHAQPIDAKLTLKANSDNVGYMPIKGSITKATPVAGVEPQPNLVEAFFLKRDLPANHPDVIAKKRFRPANQWPDPEALPDFRPTMIAYMDALEGLGKSLLPLYATALDLPVDWFTEPFREPQYVLRCSHYPPHEPGPGQFGIAPHTDSSFITMLAQSGLPGLAVLSQSEQWIEPPPIEGSFVVNSGEMMKRWTNERFLATPHRVINRTPNADRYAIPFFFDCTLDHPMTCIPTCHTPENPPKYDATSYAEYMAWFYDRNYAHARKEA